jgi:hypothetical protein
MGVGRISPDASVSRGANGEFDGREASSTVPLSAYSETLDGDSKQENNAAVLWENNSDYSATRAAARDEGYSRDLAAHIRAQDSTTLFNQYSDEFRAVANGDAYSLTSQARFAGGVLVSRDDNPLSAEDIYGHEETQLLENQFHGFEYDEIVFSEMDEFLSEVDEYVAGQVCSEVNQIEIDRLDDAAGRMKTNGTMQIDPRNLNPRDGPARLKDLPTGDSPTPAERTNITDWKRTSYGDVATTVQHELVHAFHHSIGLTRDGYTPKDDIDQTSPDDLELDGKLRRSAGKTGTNQQFMEDVEQAAERMVQTMKDEVPLGEAEMRPLRDYQKKSFNEVITSAYELYGSDLISSVNEQRPMADVFDEYFTGGRWEEVSADSLETSGVEHDDPRVADVHYPRIGATGSYDDKSDFGEVALLECDHELHNEQSHVAGIVTGVDNDTVTISYLGNQVIVDRDDINSVKRRQWSE